jgi:hypothetical protein
MVVLWEPESTVKPKVAKYRMLDQQRIAEE